MADFFKIKHSFNAGDAIVLLPGLKNLYAQTGKKTIFYQRIGLPAFYYDGAYHPVKTDGGDPVCMNEKMWQMLKPLIESQEYIESAEVWEGQEVDFDIDLTRDSKSIPMPAGLIHHYAPAVFPELSCDLSEIWLNGWDGNHFFDGERTIIINRTQRYQNPYITYFFLKEYQDKIIFAGLENERKLFCDQWGLDIPLLEVNNFLELAKAINNCQLFIGNQSLCWHIADAMKVNRILELCPQFPNTFSTGKNGHAFYTQKNLEYHFKKIIL